MIPIHKQIEDINAKLDEVLSYVKPVTQEIGLQEQLDIALAQIESLRQVLVEKAQGLQTDVIQMQQETMVEPAELLTKK